MISQAPERRPRVLFINRSYWPDVEATGQLLTELAESLAGEFEVSVLCGKPRKIVGSEPPDSTLLAEHNGVTIRRVSHTTFRKSSFAGRIANMLSFQLAAAWAALTSPRADIVVVETDPPFLCMLGRTLQLLRRARLICYLQDVYPDIAVALGKLRQGAIAGVLRRVFFGMYRHSDAVVVLSRDMKDLLVARGVDPQRLQVIPNWIDTEAVVPKKNGNQFRARHALDDKFVVMYSGNLGMSQNLEMVLDAASLLRDRADVKFVFVGDGVARPALEALAASRQLANVEFHDYQPKSELATSLSAADVHLVVLQPQIRQLLMPSKLYGALASGTPVLAIADRDCELSQIVACHNLGSVVDDPSPRALAEAIVAMADNPQQHATQGANARAYAEANCTRERSVAAMRTLLMELGPANCGARAKQDAPAAKPVRC